MDYGSDYLTKHLITYLGNKRKLLQFIDGELLSVMRALGTNSPTILDGFSGSGCVARLFKHRAGALHVNDLEGYVESLNRCYLANSSELDVSEIYDAIDYLNSVRLDANPPGFIGSHYAPADDTDIQEGERAFYTTQNALIIDNVRRTLRGVEGLPIFDMLVSPLLVESSIHTNTSGIFVAFHKKDGRGHFGGGTGDSLKRIRTPIELEYPIWCDRECPVTIYQQDTNALVKTIPELDIAYFDPPYNQRPYGSNYWMLNVIRDYNDPEITEGVTGIIKGWNRSAYNKKQEAALAMDTLIASTPAKYILVSYNDDGIIPIEEFRALMERHGTVELKTCDYAVYPGFQNVQERSMRVNEHLWVLRR